MSEEKSRALTEGQQLFKCFLYILMRDYVTIGKVEEAVRHARIAHGKTVTYSSPLLANYAEEIMTSLQQFHVSTCGHPNPISKRDKAVMDSLAAALSGWMELGARVCHQCPPPSNLPIVDAFLQLRSITDKAYREYQEYLQALNSEKNPNG